MDGDEEMARRLQVRGKFRLLLKLKPNPLIVTEAFTFLSFI
jgi:hypothetical protein